MMNRRTKVNQVLLGFIVTAAACNSLCTAAGFRGLGFVPGGTCSEPRAVSADGMVVVGTACTPDGVQAFRWRAGEGFFCIPMPAGLTKTWGVGVSADGNFVLGQGRKSDNPSYAYQGFLWNHASGLLYDIVIPNRNVYVTGMTGDGSAVLGNAWTSDMSESMPYRWRPGQELEPLNLLYEAAPVNYIEAVSADGQVIVGSKLFDTYPYRRIICWTQNQVFAFGANIANATSTDGSAIVGRLDNLQTHLFEAYRWTADAGAMPLGTCLPGHHSHAMDVSGDGSIVVGYVQSDSTDEQLAMIWDAEHGMRLVKDILQNDFGLDLTGWKLNRALAISEDGSTIVGDGWNPQNQLEAWRANMTAAEGRVYFADARLKATVEKELGICDPDTIDMLSLTRLDAGHLDISDIAGLQHATNLTCLDLEDNHISNLSALSSLAKLNELQLDSNRISDITPLAGLKSLRELDLEANRIRNIAGLSELTQLNELDLGHNLIGDISALSGMMLLAELELHGNPLSTTAYCTDLPLVQTNNPGIIVTVDLNPNPLTADCVVDQADLLEFAELWLDIECDDTSNWCGGGDVDHSGSVDLKDFCLLGLYWLESY